MAETYRTVPGSWLRFGLGWVVMIVSASVAVLLLSLAGYWSDSNDLSVPGLICLTLVLLRIGYMIGHFLRTVVAAVLAWALATLLAIAFVSRIVAEQRYFQTGSGPPPLGVSLHDTYGWFTPDFWRSFLPATIWCLASAIPYMIGVAIAIHKRSPKSPTPNVS